MIQDPNITSVIGYLLQNYGPVGGAFGILLYLILRHNKAAEKRITDLEAAQQKQYEINLTAHKDMINDYVDLVRNKTQVLADLTACLNAIKNTLERLENRHH